MKIFWSIRKSEINLTGNPSRIIFSVSAANPAILRQLAGDTPPRVDLTRGFLFDAPHARAYFIRRLRITVGTCVALISTEMKFANSTARRGNRARRFFRFYDQTVLRTHQKKPWIDRKAAVLSHPAHAGRTEGRETENARTASRFKHSPEDSRMKCRASVTHNTRTCDLEKIRILASLENL